MELSEFDMRILRHIKQHESGCSYQELAQKFGNDIYFVMDNLTNLQCVRQQVVSVNGMLVDGVQYDAPPVGNYLITQRGAAEVARYNFKFRLTAIERLKNRIYGFVFGVAAGVLIKVLCDVIQLSFWK